MGTGCLPGRFSDFKEQRRRFSVIHKIMGLERKFREKALVRVCELRGRLEGQILVELGKVALQRFGRKNQGQGASRHLGVQQPFAHSQGGDLTGGGAAQTDNLPDSAACLISLSSMFPSIRFLLKCLYIKPV